jgi:hypothetical protein
MREPARPGTNEVDHVTGDVFCEMRKHCAKSRSAYGPSVHEQYVGSFADDTVRDLARTDIEKSIWLTTKDVSRVCSAESHSAPTS